MFKVHAKWDSDLVAWTLKIENPNHDHGSIPNLKAPKLPDLNTTQPTKKRKQRSDVIKIVGEDRSDFSNQHKTLISKLNTLDSDTHEKLLQRFFRDCEVAIDIGGTDKKVSLIGILSDFFLFIN
jgi:hypothetical protein